MTTANDTQIGGDHYRSEYQHWDFVEQAGLGYLEGCATKYVSRWRKKNGLQDLEKADHYLKKLIELYDSINRGPRGMASEREVERFTQSNHLSRTEGNFVALVARWQTREDLVMASLELERLMQEGAWYGQ